MIVLAAYVALFVLSGLIVSRLRRKPAARFGDVRAITSDRVASVLSVLAIFAIWGAFTGSSLVPVHVPGPFLGQTAFSYGIATPDGATGQAEVRLAVHRPETPDPAPDAALGSGPAQGDGFAAPAWRTTLLRVLANDATGAQITSIAGQPASVGQQVAVPGGQAALTARGSIAFTPDSGWQMEPIWLPPPEKVLARFVEIARDGYQNTPLWDHLGYSLFRVLAGLLLGALVGIPLGFAMGLSGWVRGWFDPIVEFMRPVPPLALIPLVIIWFGIWETGKIVLLFLAALWIMAIAARSGVSGVRLAKVQAAYSLGASPRQVLTHVIVPNALPDIFTGLRVALGVCWGTVVAAELVAAEKGAGMMILVASKFQLTDIVVMGIILIGSIGFAIDLLMRRVELRLVPWRGKA